MTLLKEVLTLNGTILFGGQPILTSSAFSIDPTRFISCEGKYIVVCCKTKDRYSAFRLGGPRFGRQNLTSQSRCPFIRSHLPILFHQNKTLYPGSSYIREPYKRDALYLSSDPWRKEALEMGCIQASRKLLYNQQLGACLPYVECGGRQDKQ